MKIYITRKFKKPTYTIGRLEINGEYVCDTLEPTDRGFTSTMSMAKIVNNKVWGKTAIPTGAYTIDYRASPKFHDQRRAYLVGVTGFSGVMIHEGNYPKDTQGCILVGRNNVKGAVTESRKALGEVNSKIADCQERGEPVTLEVVRKYKT